MRQVLQNENPQVFKELLRWFLGGLRFLEIRVERFRGLESRGTRFVYSVCLLFLRVALMVKLDISLEFSL